MCPSATAGLIDDVVPIVSNDGRAYYYYQELVAGRNENSSNLKEAADEMLLI